MLYLCRHPPPPLSHFIDSLWSLSDAPPHRSERILPSGTLELVINLHEDEFRIYDPIHTDRCRRFSGAVVSGAYRASFIIDTREHASIIGVHFRPGGALPFLGAPPGVLADTHVELEALWARRAVELRERLCAATTPALRFRILEDALIAELRRRPFRRHHAVPAALDYLRQVRASVGDLAARVQLSHRRLIEVFAGEVGMTPKLYARVGRFQRAAALARRMPSPDWGRLAIECGYFDQSHLIRDFCAFANLPPEEFLRHREDRVKNNHLALGNAAGSNSSKTHPSFIGRL